MDVAVDVSWLGPNLRVQMCLICPRCPDNNARLGRSVCTRRWQVRNSRSSGIHRDLRATVSPGYYHGCGRTQDGRGLGETTSQPWAAVERLTRNSIKATRKEYLLSSVCTR